MALNNLSEDFSSHDLGDWLELAVLKGPGATLSLADLKRQYGIMLEEDDDQADILSEQFLQRVNDVILDRIDRVGADCYPFVYSQDGNSLQLKDDLSDSECVYLFCLLLSHTKRGEVLDGSYVPTIDDATRRYFQACSTVAAAGFVQGSAIWFGFPRPDGSAFLKKLKEVFALIEDGLPVEQPRPGTSPAPKDGEIDIIAWKFRDDVRVPEIYFLAQVASGNNWDQKTIKGQPVDTFHHNWFQQCPATVCSPGLFMPMLFSLLTGATFEQQVRIYSEKFGHFFYRFSIPNYYRKGIEMAANDENVVDGVQHAVDIRAWVEREKAALSAV